MAVGDKTILVIDPISPYSQSLCKKHNRTGAEIVFYTDEQALEKNLSRADVLVTSTRAVPTEMIKKLSRCRFIQKLGTGVKNLDMQSASKCKIYVGNVAGANSLSVAEYAVMLIMASCRHINIAHNRLVQEGRWEKSTLRDSCCEVTEKTIGIAGFGNIGRRVAKLLSGFSCHILYHDVLRLDKEEEKALNVIYSSLDDLVRNADIISLHTPLTETTKHMINAERLAMMKDTAVLVNTGRGGLIDEAALYDTLKQGKLLGVALDVHEIEPMPDNDPLKEFERVIFSPHTGAGTRESMNRVIGDAFENINEILGNNRIKNRGNIVNQEIFQEKDYE
jgi:phosphoglycerate dehydrogenase-like enzyme